MIPVYIAFAVVVVVLVAVIALLVMLLVRQQEQHIKVQDDLNNRLMTHTWSEYALNRQAEAADRGAHKAKWQPGQDTPERDLKTDPTPEYHDILGADR